MKVEKKKLNSLIISVVLLCCLVPNLLVDYYNQDIISEYQIINKNTQNIDSKSHKENFPISHQNPNQSQNLTKIASYKPPTYVHDFLIIEDFLYMAAGYDGFRIFDVRNQLNPFEVFNYINENRAFKILFENDSIFVA